MALHVSVVACHAPETTRRRILARREAEASSQNTTLTAKTQAELEAYGRRSVEFADLLQNLALEDFALATDDRTPRELATEAVDRFLTAVWASAEAPAR